MTVIFSDLHLREQSEEVCFRVLEWIERAAVDGGRHVVCCGDFWHLRYQVNVRLLNRVHELLTRWGQLDIELDLVPGNHDQVDVAGANALEVFAAHDRVRVWTEPGVLEDYALGFVPYRKDPEEQIESLLAVAAESPQFIFAHYGIKGAVMNSGRTDQDGIGSPGLESQVILGHYHKRQSGPGWQYVGSPYQTNFGEAGNVCGALELRGGKLDFCPIEVGAPKHHVIEWDPAASDDPPERPGEPGDKVRLDLRASQEMIVKGKFKSVLKASGLDEAQVNVIPVTVDRELKLTLEHGEALIHAAERFACERLGTTHDIVQAGLADRTNPAGAAMAALRRWADEAH